ncbi:MAG TPA: DMT family transporter [Gemmatimonadaceae bacterium]|jgi:drug/metabolite transporter (DMT)-like permease|nr:DMT family transporter [Gemmatimonadaceae bacterium]
MQSPARATPHDPDHRHHPNRAASFALALGVFGIGWSAILVRWSGVSGMVSAFYRLLFAAFVLLPWFALRRSRRAPPTAAAKRAAVFAGIVFAADLAFFNSSIMITSAANATLLGVNSPVFVAIGAWLLYGERPGIRFWIGFALSLIGVASIVGTDVVLHPKLGFGDALAVTGAMCYGVYLLYVQRARGSMDTLTFSTWCVCAGAVTLLPICLVAHEPLWGFGARTWASLIGLALATQLMGHFFVAYALGHLPVTLSSVVLLAQAPLTALLAWPLLGEPLRLAQIIGGLLVLSGIFVVNSARRAGSSAG